MQIENYMRCAQYKDKAAAAQAGFSAFEDAETHQHYFAMLDADGDTLLKSEGYPNTAARDNGIESVIKNRSLEERYKVAYSETHKVYYMSLRAGNHQEIARSCSCATEAEALALLPYLTMKKTRKAANRNDHYMRSVRYEGQTAAPQAGFTAFQDSEDGMFYFAMLDADGKVLLKSESYPGAAPRNNCIESVIKNRTIEERYKVVRVEGNEDSEYYYLSLRAANYQEIARSSTCSSAEDAMALLPFVTLKQVRGNVAVRSSAIKDDYLPCDDYKNHSPVSNDGFVKFKSQKTDLFYFAVYDKNNKLLLRSEGYPNTQVRDNGIESVIKNRDLPQRYKTIEENGHYFVSLRAGNHQEIARSCPFENAALAAGFISSDKGFAYGALAAGLGVIAAATNLEMPEMKAKANIDAPDINIAAERGMDMAVAAGVGAAALTMLDADSDAEVAEEIPAAMTTDKDDDYLPCADYKGHLPVDKNGIARFSKNGQDYFVWYDGNGNVRLRSEGFTDPAKLEYELAAVLKYRYNYANYETIEKSGHRIRVLSDDNGREVGRSCVKKVLAAAVVPPVAPVVEATPEVPVAALAAGAALVGAAALAGANINAPKVETPEVEPVAVAPVAVAAVAAAAAVAAPVATAPAAAAQAEGGGGVLPWLLGGAAVLGAVGLGWWFMNRNSTAEVAVATPDASAAMVIVPDTMAANAKADTVNVAAAAPKGSAPLPTNAVAGADGAKLHWIFFDFDKADLRTASNAELDKLADLLTKNAGYKAELRAYTDAKGNVDYNKKLSKRRATAALDYLKSKGISTKRLRIKYFGKSDPIAKNNKGGEDTEEGRQLNRRVELVVLDDKGKNAGIVEKTEVPTELKAK